MNAPFLHRSLTESKNTFSNGHLTSDIIYGDSSSFNLRTDIWTSQYEQVFPMLYSEGYAIHEHLAPFGLVYLKELTGYFAEGSDIGTSSLYNNLSINDDLGNVNSSIETGCNTQRQTDWVKDKPGQEAYFDKNVTSNDDPDLKGRIYVGKTFIELRENNFLYYGDEKGDLYQDPLPIFSFKKDTREPAGQGGSNYAWAGVLAFAGTAAVADGPIPIGDAIGGAVVLGYGTYVLADKMTSEITRIYEKVNNTRGFTYELRATTSGLYPNVRGGVVSLNAGDVWKYGETTQGYDRYSQNFLTTNRLQMVPIFYGNVAEIKVQEKIMIYWYYFQNGTLPAGIRIFR